MSYRLSDEDLRGTLRRLQQRVDELESQSGTRKNDIRIGDVVISWEASTNRVTFRNIATGGPTVYIAVP